MTTKKTDELTLHDRLSRLTFAQACNALGSDGERLIREGGKLDVDNIEQSVRLSDSAFRVEVEGATATITLGPDRRHRLRWHCDRCPAPCAHVGFAFALLLEEKLALGLAAPPPDREPAEMLSEEALVERALGDRAERARTERMRLRSTDPKRLWTDYVLTSAASGKTYRLGLRGWERGESYCSCPDFRTNTLGTCKHILHALAKVERRFPAHVRRETYRRQGYSVHVRYAKDLELRLLTPPRLPRGVGRIISSVRDRPIDDPQELVRVIAKLEQRGHEVVIYPDAEELLERRLLQADLEGLAGKIRLDPAHHPLRISLLRTELLPYQLEGIAFAVGAGRAVLADDMGLGKTIQGIGVAELLARRAGLRRVLVVCPASVKGQWRAEIERFSPRTCQLVVGRAAERAEQYASDVFFTICNYEQVLRDILFVERQRWDLIILDEGQRIKNWEAKTTRVIKGLRSAFALVLSGTPLENNLGELFSVVSFIDDRRLGPAFRFFHRHRVVDTKGRVLGYQNLAELRRRLAPVLLRRTRREVMKQLPPRSTEIVRVPPTDEQLELHHANMRIVSKIVRKPYLTEMDLLRLRKALLMCRMSANATFLVTKQLPSYSSKLDRLGELLADLAAEEERKIILFSEWTTMLDLIEPQLEALDLPFVRLDGSVPQKKRQSLVHRFGTDPDCPVFLTTNAGSTGLNLQAADTVINVDLPWNPAVLEQRIARAHRMGQQRPVQVYVLVTEETIEENLLFTLSAKQELATAALDASSDLDEVATGGGIEELKRRLEVLLGAAPDAPLDQSERDRVAAATHQAARRERIAAAGGKLLSAAFGLLGEILPAGDDSEGTRELSRTIRAQLDECLERDASGAYQLTVTLPDPAALDSLASSLGQLLGRAGPPAGPGR